MAFAAAVAVIVVTVLAALCVIGLAEARRTEWHQDEGDGRW